MSRTPRLNVLAIACAVALAVPAVALAKSGDIFVGDDGGGDVVRLNPDTERQKLIVPESNSKLVSPVGGAFKGGDLYIADYDLPGVARIDPKSGHVKVIKKDGPFSEPLDLDIGADGKAYVAEEQGNPAIVKVNLKSGNTDTVADGDHIADPYALTFDVDGKLLVADAQSGVIEVNPNNGNQTVICDDEDIDGAAGVAVIGDKIYTNDGDQEILEVVSEHQAESVAFGADLSGIYDMERAPHKKLYAAATTGNVVLVDPDTGDLDVIGSGDDINSPEGLTVQP